MFSVLSQRNIEILNVDSPQFIKQNTYKKKCIIIIAAADFSAKHKNNFIAAVDSSVKNYFIAASSVKHNYSIAAADYDGEINIIALQFATRFHIKIFNL